MIRPFPIAGMSWAHPFPQRQPGVAMTLDHVWRLACFMTERLVRLICPPAELAIQRKPKRSYLRDVLAWLEPAEAYVRLVFITRALDWLSETEEGRRLLRETPKVDITAIPPKPDFTPRPDEEPAMPTRTMEELEAAFLALPERKEPDHRDPTTWSCPFRVLVYQPPCEAKDEYWHGPPHGLSPEELTALDYLPIQLPGRDQENEPNDFPLFRRQPNPAREIARRIEALRRAIQHPDRHVMQAAHYLARFPAGLLPVHERFHAPAWWMQGGEEYPEAWSIYLRSVATHHRVLEAG